MINIDFPVVEKTLVTPEGVSVPSHKVILREDNNQILGVVGKDFKLIKHADVLRSIESKIPTQLELTSIDLCKNGAVMFAKYRTPRLEDIEVKVGDIVRFGLEIFNGYDGTTTVGFLLCGDRLACTNGMVVPRTISSVMRKHTGELNLNSVEDKFNERMPLFTRAVSKWREWATMTPSSTSVSRFFQDHLGKRLGDDMAAEYITNEDKTVWGLFNMLTSYRTHSIRVRDVQNKRLAQMKFDTLILDAFYEHQWN